MAPGLSPIRYTNNPANYMSVDGVVVDERTPPSPIVGQAINKVICVGEFERGPTDEVISFGTSQELALRMGDVGPNAANEFYKGALALRGKSWSRLHVLRVSNATQVVATVSLDDASAVNVLDITADSVGVWGNSLKAEIKTATSEVALEFDLEITRDGLAVELHRNLNLADVLDAENLPIVSNYVIATRIAIGDGRPVTVAATALISGADGTFDDADYTGSVGPPATGLKVLYGDSASDIRWVFVAEYNTDAVRDELELLATNGEIKNVIICGELAADSVATALTDVADYRSDRIGYAYPYVSQYLSEANNGAGGLVTVSPTSFVANLLAHMAPGQNPAGPNGVNHLKGIRGLANPSLTTANMEDFRAKGIMGIQWTKGADEYEIRSGINTSLNLALHNWARRTMTDYIQIAVSQHLLTFRNARINKKNKLEIKVAVVNFMEFLIGTGLLPSFDDLNEFRPEGSSTLQPYDVDITNLNTPANEALGLFFLTLRVRIFATMDFIIFRTEIGEGVEIIEGQA